MTGYKVASQKRRSHEPRCPSSRPVCSRSGRGAAFYVEKLGFRVHTDARNGEYRWLTVQHPDQPGFQLGLFKPQAPSVDERTAQALQEAVAKGAMPPLVLVVKGLPGGLCRDAASAASNSPRSQSSATGRSMRASAIHRAMAGRCWRHGKSARACCARLFVDFGEKPETWRANLLLTAEARASPEGLSCVNFWSV
jgi:hypothetical protein